MKRKDSKGKVLKEGEIQRKNGKYRYRYRDSNGKQHDIYADTLSDLRKKEEQILVLKAMGFDTAENITLEEQISSYLDIQRGFKKSTIYSYSHLFNVIRNDSIMKIRVKDLKSSAIRTWVHTKEREGKSFNTINAYFTGLIRPALDMAVEDRIIPSNPANFKLTSVASNKDKKIRRALTEYEVECVKDFLQKDRKLCRNNWSLICFLLETGVRVSELSGLTRYDIDLEHHKIHICRQLVREGKVRRIDTLKSSNGERWIPLTNLAESCLEEVLKDPADPNYEVDGVYGFLWKARNGSPIDRSLIRHRWNAVKEAVTSEYDVDILDTESHSLRHTFCTRLITRGVNPKAVQYLMGHGNAATTLNIYAHVDDEFVQSEFSKALK